MKTEDTLNLMLGARYLNESAIKAYYTERDYFKEEFIKEAKAFKAVLDQALANMEEVTE